MMSSPERVWIECRWANVPGPEPEKCWRLASDFASAFLQREIELFVRDYPHLLGSVRSSGFLVLDLDCGRPVPEPLSTTCYAARYNENAVPSVSRGFFC